MREGDLVHSCPDVLTRSCCPAVKEASRKEKKKYHLVNIYEKNNIHKGKSYRQEATIPLNLYLGDVLYPESHTICYIGNIGAKTKTRMYGASVCGEKLQGTLESKSHINLGFSLATYYIKSKHMTKNNISCLNAFCVDIDYRKNKMYADREPEFILAMLEEYNFAGLPQPDYAELGHQLRLIYVFAEPVFMPKPTSRAKKQKREKMFTLYRRIGQHFANVLNEEFDLCAETQLPTSFIRIPGSTNPKTKRNITITAYPDSYRYTMREFKDEFLPNLEPWYPFWIQKGPSKKKGFPNAYDIHEHNKNILLDLEKIQSYYNRIGKYDGYREVICWIYLMYAILVYNDEKFAWNELKKFNSRFMKPFTEHRLEYDLRTTKPYPLKNQTILDKLGLSLLDAKKLDLTISRQKKRKKTSEKAGYVKNMKKRRAKGLLRVQQKQKNICTAASYKEKGFPVSKIAKIMNVSTRSVFRYLKEVEKKKESRNRALQIKREIYGDLLNESRGLSLQESSAVVSQHTIKDRKPKRRTQKVRTQKDIPQTYGSHVCSNTVNAFVRVSHGVREYIQKGVCAMQGFIHISGADPNKEAKWASQLQIVQPKNWQVV